MQVKEYKIRHLNKRYFQKSTFFLYPLLKIPKAVLPIHTYLYWDHPCSLDKMVLICRFKKFTELDQLKAEADHLVSHPLYLNYYELEDDTVVYVFAFDNFQPLVELFLKGKYSKFPVNIKERLLSFYKPETYTRSYMNSYLYPEHFYDTYSKLLNVSESILIETEELTDPPDIIKEKLHLKIKNLNITNTN